MSRPVNSFALFYDEEAEDVVALSKNLLKKEQEEDRKRWLAMRAEADLMNAAFDLEYSRKIVPHHNKGNGSGGARRNGGYRNGNGHQNNGNHKRSYQRGGRPIGNYHGQQNNGNVEDNATSESAPVLGNDSNGNVAESIEVSNEVSKDSATDASVKVVAVVQETEEEKAARKKPAVVQETEEEKAARKRFEARERRRQEWEEDKKLKTLKQYEEDRLEKKKALNNMLKSFEKMSLVGKKLEEDEPETGKNNKLKNPKAQKVSVNEFLKPQPENGYRVNNNGRGRGRGRGGAYSRNGGDNGFDNGNNRGGYGRATNGFENRSSRGGYQSENRNGRGGYQGENRSNRGGYQGENRSNRGGYQSENRSNQGEYSGPPPVEKNDELIGSAALVAETPLSPSTASKEYAKYVQQFPDLSKAKAATKAIPVIFEAVVEA